MEEIIRLFCKGLQDYLDGEVADRFAHHLAHVSPEPWLILEAAYLVNRTPNALLASWKAVPEKSRVDITLVRIRNHHEMLVEFKIIHPWFRNESGICEDLWRLKQHDKPAADVCICLVLDQPTAPPASWQPRADKEEDARRFFEKVMGLVPGSLYPLQSSSGEIRFAKVVYRGESKSAVWSHYSARWCILALARGEA